MNFIKLTSPQGKAIIIDTYNIAVVDEKDGATMIELYKGDDREVAETVEAVDQLLAEAKTNAI